MAAHSSATECLASVAIFGRLNHQQFNPWLCWMLDAVLVEHGMFLSYA
jgi:hypothetical protein